MNRPNFLPVCVCVCPGDVSRVYQPLPVTAGSLSQQSLGEAPARQAVARELKDGCQAGFCLSAVEVKHLFLEAHIPAA